MSLFGSIQTAKNTLQAMQIGLQVVGNNIANADTDGFIREKANFAPTPVQELGNLTIGLGVKVDSITQVVDEFLGEQLRGATGERVSADLQNEAYKDLERLLNELSSNDLSTSLTDFFGSIEDTLNPTSGDALSVRNLAVLEGTQLAGDIQRIEQSARELRDGYDEQIVIATEQVNRLAEEIQALNIRITQVEGGTAGTSDAGALRVQRNNAVNDLNELLDVTVTEQPAGGLSISVGGEFLVFEGQRRELTISSGDDTQEATSSVQFADSGKVIDPSGGRIHGLTVARDDIVDGFRDSLDEFAGTLINEFNKVFSQGQGLEGFDSLTAQDRVTDADAALDQAGLSFSPTTGSFDFVVTDTSTGGSTTAQIDVRLVGDEDDTTLNNLASQLNAVTGVTAAVDANGRLSITGDSESIRFSFSGDTSGALAALGLNTFFTGSDAENISVNQELAGIQNAGKFASSSDGVGSGTGNATRLAELFDSPLDTLGGASIAESYDQIVNNLAQESTVAGSVAEGLAVYEATLSNEFQAISGVSIDEEAINMISLQRIFQATARYIATIQEMLDTLVSL